MEATTVMISKVPRRPRVKGARRRYEPGEEVQLVAEYEAAPNLLAQKVWLAWHDLRRRQVERMRVEQHASARVEAMPVTVALATASTNGADGSHEKTIRFSAGGTLTLAWAIPDLFVLDRSERELLFALLDAVRAYEGAGRAG